VIGVAVQWDATLSGTESRNRELESEKENPTCVGFFFGRFPEGTIAAAPALSRRGGFRPGVASML